MYPPAAIQYPIIRHQNAEATYPTEKSFIAWRFHADHVVREPKNPVDNPRLMLDEYAITSGLEGTNMPMKKLPKKFDAISVKVGPQGLVTTHSVENNQASPPRHKTPKNEAMER